MRIIVAPLARRDLEKQLDFLIFERHAPAAARRLERRIVRFIEGTLAAHPRIGVFLDHRNLLETWIPGTPLILWYRVTADELQIVRIWHGSRDRHTD